MKPFVFIATSEIKKRFLKKFCRQHTEFWQQKKVKVFVGGHTLNNTLDLSSEMMTLLKNLQNITKL